MAERARRHGFAGALILCFATPALAQQPNLCALPKVTPAPRPADPGLRQDVPVAAYTLALSWSPEHCRAAGRDDGFQCGGGNRFGFVLHGLWPDGAGKNWPQYCRPAGMLKPATVRANLCMTPSADLLQHEWAKHGTCVTPSPDAYFAAARAAYAKVRLPDMAALARDEALTVGTFTDAFVAANRGTFDAGAVRIMLTRSGRLDEIKLCLDLRRRFAACRPNQGGGAPAGRSMRIAMPE